MSGSGATLSPGDKVGQYTIESELDRGGYGVVYRAKDSTGEPVALKVLHPELAQNTEITRRFEREVRVVTLIGHPNVIRILDVGTTDSGTPFFAMELLEGRDLKQRVQAEGRMAGEEMLEILEPLASALIASHDKGVIHRDLKPSNIFLANRVVLLDFGIAKLMEDTGAKITSSRHVVGTPPSMAPEQITGSPLDERTDVYALGALVFFMLTARMPFVHTSVAQLLELQLRAPAPLPSRYAPVSPGIDTVVLRALAKDADDRQPSVKRFLEEIRAALSGSIALDDTLPANQVAIATAVHVELTITTEMADLDEDALDVIEAVLPAISKSFVDENYRQTSQSQNSVLLLHPEVTVEDATKAAEAAIAPYKKHDDFELRVHVRAGPLKELPKVGSWVPTSSTPGVHIV